MSNRLLTKTIAGMVFMSATSTQRITSAERVKEVNKTMTEVQEKVLVELTEDWSKKLEEAYLAYKKLLNYQVYLSVQN
jgi:hypothetical protein